MNPDGCPSLETFATTQWTRVLNASGSDDTQARAALEDLCRDYWRPIYAFVRRLGNSPHDAQDLTQEFFARLLFSGSLRQVHPEKGRFRSFLLVLLKRFLANEWDKSQRLKRGGNVTVFSIDAASVEGAFEAEDPSAVSPEQAFDCQWALTLLDRVLNRLEEEHKASGKAALFKSLKHTLTTERRAVPYVAIGQQLNLSEGAVKVAVHRLRQRYREILGEEIARTTDGPGQAEAEMRDLFAALAGGK
jgi:RNA polymerase sigma factor (sigma-70 family)